MNELPCMACPEAADAGGGRVRPSTAVARLLAYPDDGFDRLLAAVPELVAAQVPDAGAPLQLFRDALAGLSPTDREELYTRTFDVNPACALEIGWHLFGEEYHRGALLVRLRDELRRHGIPEGTELPDHLLYVLPLLDRMDGDRADDFAACCVLPALEKMGGAFAGKGNAYGHLLQAVMLVVQQQYGASAQEE